MDLMYVMASIPSSNSFNIWPLLSDLRQTTPGGRQLDGDTPAIADQPGAAAQDGLLIQPDGGSVAGGQQLGEHAGGGLGVHRQREVEGKGYRHGAPPYRRGEGRPGRGG